MTQYLHIPLPVHPDDAGLPISMIDIRLPSGKIARLVIPIQGGKTIETALVILELWKPTLVVNPIDFVI